MKEEKSANLYAVRGMLKEMNLRIVKENIVTGDFASVQVESFDTLDWILDYANKNTIFRVKIGWLFWEVTFKKVVISGETWKIEIKISEIDCLPYEEVETEMDYTIYLT